MMFTNLFNLYFNKKVCKTIFYPEFHIYILKKSRNKSIIKELKLFKYPNNIISF